MLKDTMSAGARIAKAELDIVRSALAHGPQKGRILEEFVLSLLRRHLPERIGVTEGIVVSSDGECSTQMDLIVYDADSAPLLYSRSETRVIPIEFVFAVGEVKAQVSVRDLDRIRATQAKIKRFRKYYEPGSWIYHGYGRDWQAPPTFSFVFAFESPTGPDALTKAYVRHHIRHPVNETIDLLYVNDVAFFTHHSEAVGPNPGNSPVDGINRIEEDPLFYFLAMLAILSTDWRMRQRPLMYRYFQGPAPKGQTLRFASSPVSHPDVFVAPSSQVGRQALDTRPRPTST